MIKKYLPPSHFLNRELGLLEFNRRVLAQAADESVPLLERLRFLTIASSNLDEFFEIRVAGLKEQIKDGIKRSGPDGRSPGAIPDISGKNAEFIRTALQEFRSGKLASTVMGRHAKGYTDEEVALIADYLASRK